MTRTQITSLQRGQYVQEQLGTAHGRRGKRFVTWGRPRQVSKVEKLWRCSNGKWCVHFAVRFGKELTFHWTAIEESAKHRIAPAEEVKDLDRWERGAEKSMLTFPHLGTD